MLRACLHHGFSELTQIDTFYNGLNEQDQDSLNAATGGNFLSKTTREALKIIQNKSKVRYSRSKSNVSRVNTNSRESSSKTFFPPSKTTYLRNEITNFLQKSNETFNEACKSKVRYSRSRVIDVRANANAPLSSSSHSNSFDLQQISRKFALHADQTIAIINVHSLEEEMIFPYFTITSNSFRPQQSEIFNQNRQNVSNQMRPPGFHQPTQPNNNQNRFQGNNLNQNRQPNQRAIYQNRPPQNPNFQAPPQQNTVTQEPPIPPSGVNQQEPVEVTTNTEPQNSDDIHPPTVQVEVQVDKPAEEP
uniref:Reverse transcriptase domain-containing protein n=1 Tax=Tanacetum cinerariifolium TaxID=118510 RepID=A0A699K8D8_TANCI|nr:reverse transcriptase domain-containing protein [Tanacetum cinerariifolium]